MNADLEFEPDQGVPTLRDLITPLFRQKWAGFIVTLTIFLGAALLVVVRPNQYEAEMKILVKRERVDPLVSGDPNVRPQVRTDVTEDDLNSEVELLKSRDLLEQVAVAAGVDSTGRPASPAAKDSLPRAVQRLQANLKVSPIRRTAFIKVSYRASDPAAATRVLTELARLYPDKHLALHRPPGAYEFFRTQAERFRSELDTAEARLKEFNRREQIVSADLEQQATLQRLADFEAALQQAHGSIADAERRIAQLDADMVTTPPRHTTQIRTSDNRELVGELKSRIFGLEVKHAEMRRKFASSYPPALEVEQELTQARVALARAEATPLTEETTDHNPTYQWLLGERARVKTERAASMARSSALAQSVALYRDKARQLDEQAAAQQDLTRAMRSAEENYLLYNRKQEEARISDALDRTRIVNVAIAEAPTEPSVPAGVSPKWLLMLAAVVAVVMGVATTYLLDYLSPYFRTPDEVESVLAVPVLTSLPARR